MSLVFIAKVSHDTDGVIRIHWFSLGFINILKSWTHLEFKNDWNSLGFSIKIENETDGIIQKWLYFLHYFKIFEVLKSFLLKFHWFLLQKWATTPLTANSGYEIPKQFCSI